MPCGKTKGQPNEGGQQLLDAGGARPASSGCVQADMMKNVNTMNSGKSFTLDDNRVEQQFV